MPTHAPETREETIQLRIAIDKQRLTVDYHCMKKKPPMPMKNPPHPGKVVRVSCLEPLGLSVTEGARALGVSRQALSNLVNGRARVSSEMAIRLAKAFGSTTETWIRLQTAYDIAQALEREDEIKVERYEPQPA